MRRTRARAGRLKGRGLQNSYKDWSWHKIHGQYSVRKPILLKQNRNSQGQTLKPVPLTIIFCAIKKHLPHKFAMSTQGNPETEHLG